MIKLIKEVRKPEGECQVPVILVGNKKDLRRGRSVSKEEARETASEFACSYYETSALTNRNVQIVFFNMVFQVRFTKKTRQKSQGSSGNNGFLSSVRQLFNHSRRGSLPGWWWKPWSFLRNRSGTDEAIKLWSNFKKNNSNTRSSLRTRRFDCRLDFRAARSLVRNRSALLHGCCTRRELLTCFVQRQRKQDLFSGFK